MRQSAYDTHGRRLVPVRHSTPHAERQYANHASPVHSINCSQLNRLHHTLYRRLVWRQARLSARRRRP